jgi:hypothetical protein
MKGARWEFWTHSDKQGGPVAELAEVSGRIMDDKQALAFSRALAKRLKKPIGRQFVASARRNPTLVHHGFAQGAGFHVLTQAGAPLADLYVYRSLAEPIARAFANLMGIPVLLAPNDWAGEHGIKDPTGHKSPLHAGTETVAPTKRNPSGKPVAGETWHTARGGRCKVVAVRGGRVTILHMETGNRETIDLAEFLASYRFGGRTAVNPGRARRKPKRANPSRTKRARSGRSAHRQVRHELGARVARASARAVRRPARPGNAAQALYYLQHHQARSARRKGLPNPTTLTDAVAMVLDAAHWPGLAKDVRSGKMPPEPALELAHRSSNSMVQRSNLMKALRLVRRLAPKANPRPSNELSRAKKTFRKWHEFDATKAKRMKGPGRTIPKTLVKLGDLVSVVYESDKYTGKRELYEHKTKRPHPVLATDPDGRNVHIIGGKMKVTADGLVN